MGIKGLEMGNSIYMREELRKWRDERGRQGVRGTSINHLISKPWNGWKRQSLWTGPRGCEHLATVKWEPRERYLEVATSGQVATSVEPGLAVEATMSLNFGKNCVWLSHVHHHKLLRIMASISCPPSTPHKFLSLTDSNTELSKYGALGEEFSALDWWWWCQVHDKQLSTTASSV